VIFLRYQGDVNTAMTQFDNALRHYPKSPRAQFGKAQALNALAERRQSNAILEQAIDECMKVLALDDVPRELFVKAGILCAARQSFRGIICCLELWVMHVFVFCISLIFYDCIIVSL